MPARITRHSMVSPLRRRHRTASTRATTKATRARPAATPPTVRQACALALMRAKTRSRRGSRGARRSRLSIRSANSTVTAPSSTRSAISSKRNVPSTPYSPITRSLQSGATQLVCTSKSTHCVPSAKRRRLVSSACCQPSLVPRLSTAAIRFCVLNTLPRSQTVRPRGKVGPPIRSAIRLWSRTRPVLSTGVRPASLKVTRRRTPSSPRSPARNRYSTR